MDEGDVNSRDFISFGGKAKRVIWATISGKSNSTFICLAMQIYLPFGGIIASFFLPRDITKVSIVYSIFWSRDLSCSATP